MKKLLCFLLTAAILCSLLPPAYGAEAQTDLCLGVGATEDQRNVTWFALSSEPGTVLLAEKGELTNGQLPADAAAFSSTVTKANAGEYYSHKASLTGLQPETEYVYQLINEEISSPLYSFATPAEGDFSFVFAGDPQLGGSKDPEKDHAGWEQTLEQIETHEAFSDSAFLLIGGDHVNSKNDEAQFDALLHHELFSRLPMANVIGNHESGSDTFSQHFFRPNESADYGVTDAGGNAYFIYGDVLFFLLNSNDRDTEEHRAFMEEALAAHPDVSWRIVSMHHSLYTVAKHAEDSKILSRREELVPLFKELNIDLVLMGHDHVYCRSYVMDGLKPLTNPDLYDRRDYSAVTNPEGTVYITANSSSGSKTYDPEDKVFPYSAARHQFHGGEISRISITEDSLEICTYLAETMELLDRFTIFHTEETPHPFEDVAKNAWYHRAVQYSYTHHMINGTSKNTFSPELPTTRAMFVTMLYRLSGSTEIGTASFTDVPRDAYYADAVSWAAEQGIVRGISETHFAPNAPITRQQLVTILARYKGSSSASSAVFPEGYIDTNAVSSYAKASMVWALEEGLIVGTGKGRLEPEGTATRAQVAQILMRLIKLP